MAHRSNDRKTAKKAKPGRVILNTGDGKGKTTAALGTAFRALGHGQKVCVIQFLKGQGAYGERLMADKFDNLDWFICGKGFVFNKEKIDEDKKVAEEGFALAEEKVTSDEYDLVILDEITYLPLFGFLDVSRIVELIAHKPERLSVIMTGRNAHEDLIAIADTVSEIRPLKHAFEEGITAQKGIEF
ncbi:MULTISPECIES: cob(I)yrinic acid a,c-diamide adenosyltransferase [Desulfosediminicola]|uniref:cob(I)yrinic acid a,c-diamide adenosyltransferase n=1 Tax=Desulfosediminicola TaxID=2886823 RepID=UPI0010AD31E7|nr:cob(I)yrinic acid a,c-diamide adenosyltransferase [Desulfosediminicola ganghwensis]